MLGIVADMGTMTLSDGICWQAVLERRPADFIDAVTTMGTYCRRRR